MPKQIDNLDRVFGALADPTRRGVLARLCDGPRSVSELAQPYEMALPSFTQHLKVLERSGLVRSTKVGRSRIYRVDPVELERAESWLERQRSQWAGRLDRLDDYLARMQETEK